MAKSNKVLNDELRKVFLDKVQAVLTENGEEVLVVASNKVAIPCLDSEDNEKWIVLTVTVPSGERGGDGYDGYDEAEAYKFECERKATEKAQKAKEKEKKIARDQAEREAKAKAKAEAKAKKENGGE